jgi:hypothetical protein
MRKLTYVLLLLVLVTGALSVFRKRELFASPSVQNQKKVERYNRTKIAFPTAEFDERPAVDPKINQLRTEKRKRYDDTLNLVSTNPQPGEAESITTSEGFFNFPALPVKESNVVVTGVVLESTAHLSANKKGVFSEFKIAVQSVFKKTNAEILEGAIITADRIGGYVKYPNGQTVLCRIVGLNMPHIGSRYLFFINPNKKHDYTILTAYELTSEGVYPLDWASQAQALEGITEAELEKKVRALLNEEAK